MKILLIDDEKQYIENVISELEALHINVRFCPGVDDAIRQIRSGAEIFDGVVCDVMMPGGNTFTAVATDNGKYTGLLLLEKLREEGLKIPVVLLTYLESDRGAVDEAARKYAPCLVIRKRDKWSFEIAEMIRDQLRHG
jgi:CheY-like chemotaxis protein